MSTTHHGCCCEPASSEVCVTQAPCPCNSSYAVGNIDFDYQFQRNISSLNCANCGQFCCERSDYNFQINVKLAGATVSRTSACCYYGADEAEVTCTVTYQQERQCSGALNRLCPQQTYSVTMNVPVCIHVVCSTAREGCTGNLVEPNERTWRHTLEICDFTIKCTDSEICGGRNLVTDPCLSMSCDDQLNCDAMVGQTRCIGGRFTWISKYSKCLSLIGTGDWMAQGFYQTGNRCGSPCTGVTGESTSILDSNIADNGVFAVHYTEECSQGVATTCEGNIVTNAYWKHLSGNPTVDALLRSYCGTADEAIAFCPPQTNCGTVDIIQTHSFSRWTYA